MGFIPFFSGKLKQIFSCKSFDIFQLYLQKTEEKIKQVLTENHLLLFSGKDLPGNKRKKSLSNISWEISR